VSVIGTEQGISVTEPRAGVSWQGEQQTVTWHIADTDKQPVSCSSVNISLSTDSGDNFNQILVSETPNDGVQIVNLTNLNTETARVKVACHNNIFFAINTGDIIINSAGTSVTTKPVFVSQYELVMHEDEGFTLNKNKLTFSQNQNVDSITLLAGENYQAENLTLTPTLNFTGELLLKLTATKGQLTSDEFTIKVTVSAINDAPVSIDDLASVIEDSTNNSLDVLVNDTDVDNESLTIKSVSSSGQGSAVIENNKISYSPVKGFTGIEKITIDFFIESTLIKASSQQYPDFILISKEVFEKILPNDIKNKYFQKIKNKTSPLNLIYKWAKETKNLSLLVFIEIKSGKGRIYQCNDSFPNPLHPFLYIMFDRKEKEVFISTSVAMANQEFEKSGFDIKNKYKEDKKQISLWRGDKKNEWLKVGVNSTPRMTYSIKTEYAHAKVTDKEIEEIFLKAKF
ncbi:MAG: hypothetical protein HRS50_02340, partial [Mycoplasmataceae bacterium]|nr:hypothetical protein [Mycoplasmataceae bacterium]